MKIQTYIFAILLLCMVMSGVSAADPSRITDFKVKEHNDKIRLSIHSEDALGYFLHERINNKILMCEILNARLIMKKNSIPIDKKGIKLVRFSQYKENPAVVKVVVVLDGNYRYEIETDRNELYIDVYSYNNSPVSGFTQAHNVTDFSDAPIHTDVAADTVKKTLDKVSFEFIDMEIKEIVKSLGTLMNVNIIPDKHIKKEKTNFSMTDINPHDALDLFLTQYDLLKIKYTDNTYIVAEKENRAKYIKNKIQHVFKLINIEPQDVVDAIDRDEEYSRIIDTDRLILDKRTRSIVAYDSPKAINIIGRIIKDLDKKLKQVSIELKIVEMSRSDFSNLGMELPSQFNFGDIAKIRKNELTLSAHLDLLAQQNKAKILSSPKIRVVDGKSGTINVGETIPVPHLSYAGAGNMVTNAGGSITTVQPIKEWEQMNFGINLSVKPLVREDNEIELKLNISINNLINIMDGGQPHTSTRSTATHVRTKNGETVVLGGLVNQHETDNLSKTPFVEQIPFIGKLFTRRGKRKYNTELIMFITCKLVNTDGDSTIVASDTYDDSNMKQDVSREIQKLQNTISH